MPFRTITIYTALFMHPPASGGGARSLRLPWAFSGLLKMRGKILAIALALLALLQASMLWTRSSAKPTPPSRPAFLAVGDTIPPLQVRFEDGRRARYQPGSSGEWSVVLAFRSDCAPSRAAAPAWRTWLSTPRDVRVVAMTRDSLHTAVAFRSRHQWPVSVLSVEGVRRGSPEHALISRTPWLFLIDPSGVVRFQGHGDELPAIDSIIARHVPTLARSHSG